MDSFEKLVEAFRQLPGIGPRQARRFAYYVVGRGTSYANELSSLLRDAQKAVFLCEKCKRFFEPKAGEKACSICRDSSRQTGQLMIVAKDSDMISIEKSGAYKGRYFILGGIVPVLEKEPSKKIRQSELLKLVASMKETESLREVILAFSTNHDGESTVDYLETILRDFELTISELGRGLSTGSELEYADKETLRFALQNKKAH